MTRSYVFGGNFGDLITIILLFDDIILTRVPPIKTSDIILGKLFDDDSMVTDSPPDTLNVFGFILETRGVLS
jgi:hypothetical protein